MKNLSGAYDPTATTAEYLGGTLTIPQNIAKNTENTSSVLDASTPSNKHIYVDLSTQMLYAKEGDNTIMSFPVSTGKWSKTPTGDFTIWIKLRYTRMAGGSKLLGTYYNLPNVPYTMYFYNASTPKYMGYGLHGAYWHNNFGHPMSHGCVNISPENAGRLYDWAEPPSTGFTTFPTAEHPGTPITIYGVTPNT